MFKKYMIIVFVIIIFILICVKLYLIFTPLNTKGSYTEHSIGNGTKLSFSTEKRSYKNGENFTVKMRLKNIKLTPITIGSSCHIFSQYTTFKDLNQYTLGSDGISGSLGVPSANCNYEVRPPRYLYPGESITETYEFSRIKNNNEEKEEFTIKLIGEFQGNTLTFPIHITNKESDE